MDRFRLNFYQIIGLMTYSIGGIIKSFLLNPVGLILIIFGLLVFLISSKLNAGIIVSVLILLIGFLVKMMHWPTGNEIILLGLISLIISGFIKFIYKRYRLDLILIFMSVSILFMGIYFKINHLRLNMELILIGFVMLIISYFIRFIAKDTKNFEDYNKLILVIFWSISSIFTIFHLSYSYIFSMISLLTLWLWLISSLIRDVKISKLTEYQRKKKWLK